MLRVATYVLAGASALISVPAIAQTEGDDRPEDVIVVIGEGLPQAPSVVAYAVSEIERPQILAAPSGRIEDVLANIAGIERLLLGNGGV
ncbi:MAG: hypothetical protein ACO25F_12575, partial [Erythrobacter sp.]